MCILPNNTYTHYWKHKLIKKTITYKIRSMTHRTGYHCALISFNINYFLTLGFFVIEHFQFENQYNRDRFKNKILIIIKMIFWSVLIQQEKSCNGTKIKILTTYHYTISLVSSFLHNDYGKRVLLLLKNVCRWLKELKMVVK